MLTFALAQTASLHAQTLQPQWATYHGGPAEDWGVGLALDTDGSIALGGRTASVSGIAFNAAQAVHGGGNFDGHLARFNAQGQLQWATYHGGPGHDYGSTVAIATDGRVMLAGHTTSQSGLSFNAGQPAYGGGESDGFLACFSDDGALLWSTYLGGEALDAITSMATSADGSVYVTGNTQSLSGFATPGAHQGVHGGGGSDAFLAKYDADGLLLWCTYIGGDAVDYGESVHVDGDGAVIVCGSTQSANGIHAGATHQSTSGGGRDAFLMKFDADGQRVWGTYFGGSGFDQALEVTSDAAGNICLAGSTTSAAGIALNGHQNTLAGGFDAFLARFNSEGMLQWGTYYGGGNYDDARGVAVTNDGTILLAGQSGSPSGIATPDAFQPANAGLSDGYVARFSPSGARLWGSYLGGPSGDGLFAARVHPNGWAVVSGNTMSASGIATPGAQQEFFGGGGDGFLVKLADMTTGLPGTEDTTLDLLYDPYQELALLLPSTPSWITVVDAQGRLVHEVGPSDRVSLTGSPPGIYLFRVTRVAHAAPVVFRIAKH